MAETFNNYLKKITSGDVETNVETIIIPYAKNAYNSNDSTRSEGSTAQVHSLYITQVYETRKDGKSRYDETSFKHVDLYIETTSGGKYYLGHDILIVPGSSYFFEKNITLSPEQRLCICIPTGNFTTTTGSSYNNTSDLNIHVTASTVEFTND